MFVIHLARKTWNLRPIQPASLSRVKEQRTAFIIFHGLDQSGSWLGPLESPRSVNALDDWRMIGIPKPSFDGQRRTLSFQGILQDVSDPFR